MLRACARCWSACPLSRWSLSATGRCGCASSCRSTVSGRSARVAGSFTVTLSVTSCWSIWRASVARRACAYATALPAPHAGDLGGVGKHRVEHPAVAGRQIERRPLDPGPPRLITASEPPVRLDGGPGRRRRRGAARGGRRRSESTTTGCGTDRCGRTASRPSRAQSRSRSDRVIDELLTDRDDSVHHRMPAAAEIAGDIGDRPAVPADLDRRPPRRPGGQHATGRGDRGVVVAPAAATRAPTTALLAPHQGCPRPVTSGTHPSHISRRAVGDGRYLVAVSSDPMAFEGTARFYAEGRSWYSHDLPAVLERELGLDGTGMLLDVGCGPGILTIPLAPRFREGRRTRSVARHARRSRATSPARWGRHGHRMVPGESRGHRASGPRPVAGGHVRSVVPSNRSRSSGRGDLLPTGTWRCDRPRGARSHRTRPAAWT